MAQREYSTRGWRSGWLPVAGLIGVTIAALGRSRKLAKVSPELRSLALLTMPPLLPPLIPLIRHALRRLSSHTPVPPGVLLSEHQVQATSGNAAVRVLVLRRKSHAGVGPALVWMHGGGYVIGTPETDMALLARILDNADVTIFSVDYRLAPRDRFPAALDDAASVLHWVVDHAGSLGVDPERIAVGGNSAGGGLAAALAQRAHDEAVPLVFQLLMYPMLDDRTACLSDHAGRGELVWTPGNNRYGWTSYLGTAPGSEPAPAYAAPARRQDLTGLAPAWIGVGSLDLFHEEDVAYAGRLRAAGVSCALDVVADAPHAFDLLNFDTRTARTFHGAMVAALLAAFASGANGVMQREEVLLP